MQAKIWLSERKGTLDNRSLTLSLILIFFSKAFPFCTLYSFCISCLQQTNSANIIYQSSFVSEQQPGFLMCREGQTKEAESTKLNGWCPSLWCISLNIVEISLKAARTHHKVPQEETNSCSDLLYQFAYSRYSITQLKEKKWEREENWYKPIAISSWCLWFLNWVIT